MAGKIRVFEAKKKGKDGSISTSVYITGSVLPERKVKAISEDAKVVKFKKK